MAGAQKLSYASALSSPPPKNNPRPIKRLPAVFSRRGRGSRSSRTPAITVGAPQIESAQTNPTPSFGSWKESEGQSGCVEIQPQNRSRLVDLALWPSDPMPGRGVWKEMETEIEVFKSAKRPSRFSGFFASPDYQKRFEMTERTKLTERPAAGLDIFPGIFAWQGNRGGFERSNQNGKVAKPDTESADPFHTWMNGCESPTLSKQVAELVATPTPNQASFPAFFPDSYNWGLIGGSSGDGDVFRVVGAPSVYRRRHSGSMSSVDGDDDACNPYIQINSFGSPSRQNPIVGGYRNSRQVNCRSSESNEDGWVGEDARFWM